MMHLRRVLEALRPTELMVNLKKSKLGQRAIHYLGFHIGLGKIWAGPDKVAALRNIHLPPMKNDLQRFLGFANYYWWFVPQFSAQASPLIDLLKGKGKGTRPLSWTCEAQDTFEDIRSALCQTAVLYAPLPNRPFRLYTDTSDRGLATVLTQETPSGEQSVFFLCRKLSKLEHNYAWSRGKPWASGWPWTISYITSGDTGSQS